MVSDRFPVIRRFVLVWLGLAAAALYALGVGLARYLGALLEASSIILGMLWVLGLLFGAAALDEYFTSLGKGEKGFAASGHPFGLARLNLSQTGWAALRAAFFLTLAASISVLLLSSGRWTAGLLVLVALAVIAALGYSLPPIRLRERGFGEFILVVLLVNFVPAFGFLLQFGELHRFVAMTTLPLTGLFLAFLIVLELEEYADALRQEKKNLVMGIGWENAMTLHNLAILFSYLVLTAAAFFGLPRFAWLPPFGLILVGGFQIWTMNRVAQGAPPNWKSQVLLMACLFGGTVYLLGFGFWVN